MEYGKLGHTDILSSFNLCKVAFMAFCALVNLSVDAKNAAKTAAEAMNMSREEPMVARLTRFEVKEGYAREFREALKEGVLSAMTLEGNIMSEAYHEENKPLVLWLIERWKRSEDLEKFSKSKEGRSLEALQKDALSKPPQKYILRDLEPLTKQQWRAVPSRKDKPLTVMLFVDARAGTQHQFKETYHIAMPKFRGEDGVVTYQLSEIEGDGTQFVTYEKFRNQEAFQYHLNFPPVKPVIGYLESNVKHPPFQNGLHNLVEIAPMTRE